MALDGAKLGAVPDDRRWLSASMAAIVFSPIACMQVQCQGGLDAFVKNVFGRTVSRYQSNVFGLVFSRHQSDVVVLAFSRHQSSVLVLAFLGHPLDVFVLAAFGADPLGAAKAVYY